MRLISAFIVLSVLALSLPGCSRTTREALKKDINSGAKEVDRAFTH